MLTNVLGGTATSMRKLIKNGEGGTVPRTTDNRVMGLNGWSERKKINKALHIKLSSYHCLYIEIKLHHCIMCF
jgi:hypothetical protein